MRAYLALASIVAAASVAHAGLVDPAKLKTSPDGANANVQHQLDTLFPGVSVDTDQLASELFQVCNPEIETTWTMQYQFAGQGPRAKLGYYTDLGSANPTVTWVIGGSSSGLPSSTSLFLPNTVFGLALASGDAEDGGTVYYSQTAKNADGFNHMAALSLAPCTENNCDVLTTWEDLRNGGDQDYNDDSVRVQNIESVPEPANMTILGLGALAAFRKKKAR